MRTRKKSAFRRERPFASAAGNGLGSPRRTRSQIGRPQCRCRQHPNMAWRSSSLSLTPPGIAFRCHETEAAVAMRPPPPWSHFLHRRAVSWRRLALAAAPRLQRGGTVSLFSQQARSSSQLISQLPAAKLAAKISPSDRCCLEDRAVLGAFPQAPDGRRRLKQFCCKRAPKIRTRGSKCQGHLFCRFPVGHDQLPCAWAPNSLFGGLKFPVPAKQGKRR